MLQRFRPNSPPGAPRERPSAAAAAAGWSCRRTYTSMFTKRTRACGPCAARVVLSQQLARVRMRAPVNEPGLSKT